MSRTDLNISIRNQDLDYAVKAGVLDEATALRLTRFVAGSEAAANPDDENFRLITGFNDIFVVVGLGLFFGALIGLFGTMTFPIIAILAWGLSEIFTRRMRMALPSIVLLLVFVGMIFGSVMWLTSVNSGNSWNWDSDTPDWAPLLGAATAALGAFVHWKRFHVPITVAAGCASLAGVALAGIALISENFLNNYGIYIVLIAGFGVFALAMFYDNQDRARRTQLSDRAFWLHLLAAPMIVHPLLWDSFSGGELSTLMAGLIVFVFVILCLVALAIDRRAPLVSSLAYLGYALARLFGGALAITVGPSIAFLGVGIIVLLLAIGWKPARKLLLSRLPEAWRARLPLLQE